MVHQLNNAFAKVFETVAPSVVIIEISKKNEIKDHPMKTIRGEIRVGYVRSKAKALVSSCGPMATSSRIFT